MINPTSMHFKKPLSFLLLFFTLSTIVWAQPQALDTGITINEYATVQGNSIRLVYDNVNDQLLYITGTGDIYSLKDNGNGTATETYLFTQLDHEITFVQGMAIRDSLLVVCGNINAFEPTTIGKVAKAKMQPDGSWKWSTLAQTVPYKSANNFDHLFSGIVISPDGSEVIWCSGARGTHGEIQTYDGLYPGLRGLPITNILMSLPSSTENLTLQNDSVWLAENDVVYAYGTRNFFDLEYTENGELYALENSGDRDDPEEMNHIIKGAHYGYPWTMGGNENPMQYVPFNPENDLLINYKCKAMRSGYFYEDPDFPQKPNNLVLKEPVKNFGPDADFYRDATTGEVKKASDNGSFITSFSSHRSPLGMVFEKEGSNLQDPRFQGKGFMLSWTPGGDEGGFIVNGTDTAVGTFVDESEDLVMLSPRNGSFNEINAHQIIKGFTNPIDLAIMNQKMYVLEFAFSGSAKIYEIAFSGTTGIVENFETSGFSLFPNPSQGKVQINFPNQIEGTVSITINNLVGKKVFATQTNGSIQKVTTLNLNNLKSGTYFVNIENKGIQYLKKIILE